MGWLNSLVENEFEEAQSGFEAQKLVPSGPIRTLPPRGDVPGTLGYLGRVKFSSGWQQRLAQLTKNRRGFIYDIRNISTLFDIGSAATGTNVQDRLRLKKSKYPTADFADIFVVEGLPGRALERRLVVIHELWRQYKNRYRMQRYKSWQWYFEED